MITASSITVCVCTYRRESLAACLDSIASQMLPEGVSLDIVVVDNDPDLSAESRVLAFRENVAVPVRYICCPVKNLSAVRNAAIAAAEGDYIAMIDDDEVASADWIATMFGCLQRYRADAVIGAVQSEYSVTCPDWIRHADLLGRDRAVTGTAVTVGHTANALVARSFLHQHAIEFDERLGHTGGEDTHFFWRMSLKGAVMVFCNEAPVSERADPKRETATYLHRENRRTGQVFCLALWPELSLVARLRALTMIVVKVAAFSSGAVLTLPFGKRKSAFFHFRLLRNIEKLRFLASGQGSIKAYCAS